MAKLLVTLAVLCVFGAVLVKADKQEFIAQIMAKVDECKSEVGASPADVEELVTKQPASTKEGKCFRSCIMKKMGVMDSNGKFNKSVALSNSEKFIGGAADVMKIATEMINACGDIAVSDDHCQAAEDYGKCFKEQAVAHGITDDFNW